MLMIPAYPYYIAYIYTCLAIFFVFLGGRENKDIFYTVSLPIRKSDVVKARCLMVTIIEVAQIVVSIPFAFISNAINKKGNSVGIDADVAFFGLVFIMFALFNIIFIPSFYKTAYKAGKAFVVAFTMVFVYIGIVELAVQLIKPLKKYLDTANPEMMTAQIPVLVCGILIFALTMILAYKISAKRFEKVNI